MFPRPFRFFVALAALLSLAWVVVRAAEPFFTSSPVTSATEDVLYTSTVTVSDPDVGDTLVIAAPLKPAWLTFTDNGNGTATLSGTPTNADVGPHAVTLEATDGTTPVQQTFTVTVTAVNDAPTVGVLVDQSTLEDVAAVVSVVVADEDTPLASVTLTATSSNPAVVAPGGIAVDPGSSGVRTLRLTPVANAVGTTDITVTAFDGALSSAPRTFRLTVTAVNDAPAFTSSPVTAATEDVLYSYGVAATDPRRRWHVDVGGADEAGVADLHPSGSGTATLSGTPSKAARRAARGDADGVRRHGGRWSRPSR